MSAAALDALEKIIPTALTGNGIAERYWLSHRMETRGFYELRECLNEQGLTIAVRSIDDLVQL